MCLRCHNVWWSGGDVNNQIGINRLLKAIERARTWKEGDMTALSRRWKGERVQVERELLGVHINAPHELLQENPASRNSWGSTFLSPKKHLRK